MFCYRGIRIAWAVADGDSLSSCFGEIDVITDAGSGESHQFKVRRLCHDIGRERPADDQCVSVFNPGDIFLMAFGRAVMNNQCAIAGEVIASSLCKDLILFRVGIRINNDAFVVHGVEIWRFLKLG